MPQNKINFLYTEIGRGHPFYLDGIIEEIHRSENNNLPYLKSNVFELGSGLNLKLWQLVRFLYTQSGKDNLLSKLYKKIRQENNYEESSLAIKILGSKVKKQFSKTSKPLIVAHPLLVSILRDQIKVYYQHGELITPNEAVVLGAEKVFVPIESARQPFLSKYHKEQIVVTGLCIEPSIVRMAESAFQARMQRYEKNDSLTGCFISSGAEPAQHIEILVNSIISHLNENGKAILFVKEGGALEKAINQSLSSIDLKYTKINTLANIAEKLPPLTIVQFSNRADENKFTSHFFHYFDFFVSPSHERSNWAVGLGLPMFIVDPPIGPFSPLNRKFLLDSDTATVINDSNEAKAFAFNLKKMHIENRLKQMAGNGWDKYPIDGFKKIVHNISEIKS